MARRVCPPWVGYVLLNPLRRLVENPDQVLGPLVRKGMTVVEPGCGMGFFTLPLARMVGSHGQVVAVDLQPKMLAVLRRRAEKAGLLDRIDLRLAESGTLALKDLAGRVDLVAALHVVHEVHDQAVFFSEIRDTLKPEGKLFIVEPRGHVSRMQFEETVIAAETAGFRVEASSGRVRGRSALLGRI
jgi:ubiquinone/menaquinone biosynthesis C-methylase UbiE